MKEMKGKGSLTGLEIAVIGMAGRFPGAENIDAFWENVKNGVESVAFFSDVELSAAGIDPSLIKNPNYVKAKGCLEDIEYFDSEFFGYTPREAEIMDPQVRLFHECAWHALENAGYDPWSYHGLIGLYAGYSPNMSWKMGNLFRGRSSSEQFQNENLNSFYFSTLICYKLNLKGAGVTVNTACSTSLVAIHMACRALLTGEADMAAAGGVTVTLPAKNGYFYEEGMIQSPDGHTRVFDARAKGTVPGNGVCIVVLKRLTKALKDRDHIYAVIKGTAINNDGNRKAGYTAPSVNAQAEVIRAAQRVAEVEAESVTYVETHGTGTPLGDPIEIEALKKAFKTDKKRFCCLGTLKANVGHLDSAAGAAGFIKAVLALKHRVIPPAVNFESPNPKIDLENSPFYLNKGLMEWKAGEFPLRAGVSSFGIGGTNAHVVLEEWPEDRRSDGQKADGHKPQLILLSAKTQFSLDENTHNLGEYLSKHPEVTLADAAYTLQVGRAVFSHRRMLVSRDRDEAIHALLSPGCENLRNYYTELEDKPVVFMFPGLGTQYVNMGLGLYQTEPVFREEMDRCFDILDSLVDDNVKEILYPAEPTPGIDHIEIAQIVVFIFEYALAKLLIKWGIKPHSMIGYSFGEYAAACLSGVFSLEDALRLVAARGRLIRDIPAGGMLSVPLKEEMVRPLLNNQLSIAIDNGASCIVSGSNEAIDAFEKQMKEKKYLCIRLQASHGIHSMMMDTISDQFEREVSGLTLNKPQIPFISNVTGKWITVEDAVNPGYWVNHLRETVRFADGLQELVKTENAAFVEVGPGVVLSTLTYQYIDKESNHSVVNLVPSPDQKVADVEYVLGKIGRLWLYGKQVDWSGLYLGQQRNRVVLPSYSFDKLYYSVDLPMQNLRFWGGPGEEPVEKRPPLAAAQVYRQRQSPRTPGYEAPGNKAEQMLVDMWEELLGIAPIGIHDNLLEMGVDSLKGISFVNRLKEVMGEIIHITAIFDAPTAAEQSAYFSKHYPESFGQLVGDEEEAIEEGQRQPGKEEEGVTIEKIMRFRRLMRPLPPLSKIDTPRNPSAVFVLSPPRTGSTLLRVVLAGHPRLFAPPELNLMLYNTLLERKTQLAGPAASHLQGTLRAIMEIKGCSIEEAEEIMEQFEAQGMTTQQFYCQLQEWIRDRNQVLVDKSPGYSTCRESLERIEIYFQDPFYIHLMRHPYGMIHSYVEAKMDLLAGQQLTDAFSLSRREFAEVSWTVGVQNILEFLAHIPAERQLDIKFEDLVSKPEKTVRDICRFLNLEFHPDMLQPYLEKKKRMTDGVYSEGNMIGDPKFHQHKAINPVVADNWRKRYKEDFLGEPTLLAAKSLGYTSIREQEHMDGMNKDKKKAKKVSLIISDRNLELLRGEPEGDKHLFLIHDRSGDIGGYIELGRHLNNGFSCWGIRPDELVNYTPQNLTIEETAEKYVQKIKKVQSRGPYHIAAWSFGGRIAFEMVLQLEQIGEPVACFTLIDSLGPPGDGDKNISPFTLETEKRFIKKYLPGGEFEEKLERIDEINDIWPFVVDYLRSNNVDVELIKRIVKESEIQFVPDYQRLGIEHLITYLNVGRTYENAGLRYIPQGKIHTPVHFFAASQSTVINRERWDDYCHKPITYHKINAAHYTILKMPALGEFVKKFREVMAGELY
ncbi:MAG: acyltransferase domain-containing protein [Candidatus Aminicenantes bacterium]|nr:acyltransferase domain-containing protein [Candidatus Aminicenantes bacterium]NIM78782.1 acyltransferase domain-containing protein [Candidatus Aminicenantes bacterium]NIN18037.1 acyltransferase domain-containing protein [Candidatus Aminicenantes bacterium]NIN41937.1 acyltransferase domain-containing protein [Candidatus Aminicenantes bacterium]NIN84692.1 acyltransferase domain-containing protein [Candidatus Aminicenantes bacterium]